MPARPPSQPWYRRRIVRIGVIVGLVMVLLGVTGLLMGLHYARSLDKRIDRTDAFAGLRGDRPAKSVDGALNILVIGTDKREEGQDPGVEGERSDALMILHVDADHDRAYGVSIPRDTWVFIPKHKGEGGQRDKINAAHAAGGIPLTVKTVEDFTGVKIDHVVKLDFAGFKRMTDAVGGVDVQVQETVYDPRSTRTFRAGWNHLDGEAALDFVRQRYNLPRGDLDRMQRQQVFLRALLGKATDSGMLSSPSKLDDFLKAAADSMTVDKDFSLVDLALQFRSLRMDDVAFVTMPIQGFDTIDGQSVVLPDPEAADDLFEAVRQDKMADWLAKNPPNDAQIGR